MRASVVLNEPVCSPLPRPAKIEERTSVGGHPRPLPLEAPLRRRTGSPEHGAFGGEEEKVPGLLWTLGV